MDGRVFSLSVETDLAIQLGAILGIDSGDISEDADLAQDLFIDSIQRLELIGWLADRGVDVNGLSVGHPRTLAEIRALVASSPADGRVPAAPAANPDNRRARSGRPVRLTDGRFVLRPVTPDYMPFLYELAISEDVGFRWRFRGAVPSQETFQAGFWQGILVQFVVVLATTGEPIGQVVAYNADMQRGIAYLGAAFNPEHVRTGYPLKAVDLFVRYVFQVWNLRKIYMEIPEFNYDLIASGEGSRFDLEGCLRDHNYYDGRLWDEYLLAIRRGHVGAGPAFGFDAVGGS